MLIPLLISVAIAAAPEMTEAERTRIWQMKPFSRPELPNLTKRLESQTLARALDEIKSEERAFLFVGDAACPVTRKSGPVFQFVALMYGTVASFYIVDPDKFRPTKGFRSPTLYYVEKGKVRDELSGFWVPGVTGVEQVRIKHNYEGFVVRNLFGKRAGADFVFVMNPERARQRTTAGSTNVYIENADYRAVLMRDRRISGGILRGADFRDADLRGTDFWGVDLLDAKFAGAQLDEVRWMGSTCPDGFEVTHWAASCRDHLIDGDNARKPAIRQPGRVAVTHQQHD